RGLEMLRLVQLGVVPFGTALLNLSAIDDAELAMPDLAGLNPDMAALRRSIGAFRPHLKRILRERYGSELLALYAYPAQVTFCTKPLASLADLRGRRIRVSSATQSDWVVALGALPVQTAFADVVSNLRNGNIDCAITGTMSGNAIGLHEVTSHVHTMAVNWGAAAFVANGPAWAALPEDLQALLQRELPKLEQAIWADAEVETRDGIACNVGAPSCAGGRKGRMVEVRPTPGDVARGREILVQHVLPGWLKRCGQQCAQQWKQTVGAASGLELH
ncbi:MAG: TRAP transporter substrate-binding protein, partial [Caldimonas sp.]